MHSLNKLIRLGERAAQCEKCQLCRERQNVVLGSGPVDAKLLVIGEAPGAEEDREGVPFIGDSGRVFQRLLNLQGMKRDMVYVTNTVKCRPPGNRNPSREEIDACSLYLRAQIKIIEPKAILALGSYAANFANESWNEAIGKLRKDKNLKYTRDGMDIPVVATYHPAYILRTKSKADFQTLREDFTRAVRLGFGRAVVNVPKGVKVMEYRRTIDTGVEQYHVFSCRCERGAGSWHEKGSMGLAKCPTCEKTAPLAAVMPKEGK